MHAARVLRAMLEIIGFIHGKAVHVGPQADGL
jgi:hypothetical protein